MTQSSTVILLGSPRKGGNSEILARHVEKGIKEAGGTTRSFYLHGMELHPCRGCDYCKKTGAERYCVIEDDMDVIYPALLEADSIVFASPIYWFTYSAQLKIVMDRSYALIRDEKYLLSGKSIGLVFTYGDKDPVSSGTINAIRSFQDAFRYIECPILGCVYGSANDPGEISAQASLLQEAEALSGKLAGVPAASV